MRFSTLIPLALATAPLAVSATGRLGYALGDQTADGNCKNTTDYEADFAALSSTSTIVRT
ncbi:glycoside hydrolase 3 protein, partial [Toensbergia leucococca]|nr:glycoside hydrolase 3 protein [Toensbergia leucococca]